MDLTIIFLICIINIVTFTAVGFVLWFIFKSREFDFRERMELKRLHLDKMRTLKELEIKERELEEYRKFAPDELEKDPILYKRLVDEAYKNEHKIIYNYQ